MRLNNIYLPRRDATCKGKNIYVYYLRLAADCDSARAVSCTLQNIFRKKPTSPIGNTFMLNRTMRAELLASRNNTYTADLVAYNEARPVTNDK